MADDLSLKRPHLDGWRRFPIIPQKPSGLLDDKTAKAHLLAQSAGLLYLQLVMGEHDKIPSGVPSGSNECRRITHDDTPLSALPIYVIAGFKAVDAKMAPRADGGQFLPPGLRARASMRVDLQAQLRMTRSKISERSKGIPSGRRVAVVSTYADVVQLLDEAFRHDTLYLGKGKLSHRQHRIDGSAAKIAGTLRAASAAPGRDF